MIEASEGAADESDEARGIIGSDRGVIEGGIL